MSGWNRRGQIWRMDRLSRGNSQLPVRMKSEQSRGFTSNITLCEVNVSAELVMVCPPKEVQEVHYSAENIEFVARRWTCIF